MASKGQTHAKRNREVALRERRERKQAKKAAAAAQRAEEGGTSQIDVDSRASGADVRAEIAASDWIQ